jgi:hypothetical protein
VKWRFSGVMVRELKKYVGNIGENQHVCIGSQVYFKSHQFLTHLNKPHTQDSLTLG